MKNIKRIFSLIIAASLSTAGFNATACTDFRITAKDGTVLVTRSMEFGADMKSNIRTSTQGRKFNLSAPNANPGVSWKAKYGYVYMDGMGIDAAIDGMNEAGLSFEALFFPSLAQYQNVPVNKESAALPYMYIGDWILGNFKTIDEVRQALSKVYVYAQKIPGMGDTVFPLHFSIFDASGKGIVVEYVEGKLNIYDNLGVFTNSPSYPWHLANLQNYLHLAPVNPPSVVTQGITFIANGQGFGMIGLPGDISPPSRFVKIATLLHVAIPADDAAGALNLAEHVINNVDIPLGLAREPSSDTPTSELTQWVVFKDLTHKVFYYRTYNDLSLRSVALTKLNFQENAPRLKMPVYLPEQVQDITEQFLKEKVNS